VADLGVAFDKFPTELLEIAEFRHFPFCFACRRRRRQRLSEGSAVRFIGQSEIRTVARLTWPMAAAVRFATATPGIGNGTSSKITKFSNPLSDGVATLF